MGSKRGDGSAGEEEMRVGGISFWRAVRGLGASEVNTRDELAVDAGSARWMVAPVSGGGAGPPIESAAPEVRRFLRRVVAEKERIANRYRTHRLRPVPKPKQKQPPAALPGHAPVPCPLCRPGADADHPGEAWPDCALCNGEGVVTARQAAAFHAEHG